jgi:hypothetical protein
MTTEETSRFDITNGKGFHMTFANGWTISVQFGGGSYCDHHDRYDLSNVLSYCGPSKTAEFAAWSEKDTHVRNVQGYLTTDEVAKLISEFAEKDHGSK